MEGNDNNQLLFILKDNFDESLILPQDQILQDELFLLSDVQNDFLSMQPEEIDNVVNEMTGVIKRAPPNNIPKTVPYRTSVITSQPSSSSQHSSISSIDYSDEEEAYVDEMFKDYLIRLDSGKYLCNLCQTKQSDQRAAISHISMQHGHLRPYKCRYCDKFYKHRYHVKSHEKSHTRDSKKPMQHCEKCDYKTTNKNSMSYHYYRVHTADYHFQCAECDKYFKVRRELKLHMTTHSENKYICDICGKLYRGEKALKVHRNNHMKICNYQCAICKKKFKSKENLSKHLKLHTRTFECEDCGMKFSEKRILDKHTNVHTRVKALPCHICDKMFADKAALKIHSLKHVGMKPYRCNVCGAGFSQRSAMMTHWKKMHPEETERPPPTSLKYVFKSVEAQINKMMKDVEQKKKTP